MQPIQSSAPIATAGAPARPHSWYRQILPRIRAHNLLKSVGTTAYMSVFFIAFSSNRDLKSQNSDANLEVFVFDNNTQGLFNNIFIKMIDMKRK